MERWLPVAGYEGLYEVSDRGRVRSLDRVLVNSLGFARPYRGRMLRLQPDLHKGLTYFRVSIYRDGQRKLAQVHKLVLAAFAGPCPDGMLGLHGAGGSADNRWPENLYYGTQAQNNGPDRQRDGTDIRGSGISWAKLTEEIVRECRARYDAGESSRVLAAEFGVNNVTMWNAVTGRTWRHVERPSHLIMAR